LRFFIIINLLTLMMMIDIEKIRFLQRSFFFIIIIIKENKQRDRGETKY